MPTPITLTYSGEVNGRSSYTFSNGQNDYVMSWTGASWEFKLDGLFLLSSNEANTLEPPCSSAFPWTGGQGCDFGQAPYIGGPSCSTVPLAVELIDFEAQVKNRAVALNWTTATERDNTGFSIERSLDGLAHWQDLGFVASGGNTTAATHYTFTDDAPAPGVSYYRLKAVDFGGKEEYSPVTRVYIKQNEAISLSPNPVTTILKVTSTHAADAVFSFKMYDAMGRLISEKPFTETHLEVDMSAFVSGLYFIEIMSERSPACRQVVIKN